MVCYIRIAIPVDSDMMKTVVNLSIGSVVKIKCRLGFTGKSSLLSLVAEKVEEICDVKLVLK